jgi:hypothetical protein
MRVLDWPTMLNKAAHDARGVTGKPDVHETRMVEQAFDRSNKRAELELVTR